ncbi:MAG: M67 family metallopeptidase [Gammaproteobacteria bacterium]|nr:M67 family metallopeptidase [Gammaproteobacteria bacterium]
MTNDQRPTTLYLPRPLVNKLLAHAQKNPDIEVCGLIANDTSNQKDYYPVDNISEDPNSRFLMDASQQIKAMKQMREKQQQLFAIVHSHPTTNAEPSKLDIKENDYKDVFYIIISLNTEGVLEMRAYTQQQDSMQEVDLILEDES